MVIDKVLLDDLSAQAKASPWLRQSYNLRNTPEDNSQRILNTIEQGKGIGRGFIGKQEWRLGIALGRGYPFTLVINDMTDVLIVLI